MGRPVVWKDEKKESAVSAILDRIREGESVRSILDKADRNLLPSFVTFCEWLNEDAELAKHYSFACEVRAEKIFEEVLSIADGNNQIDEPINVQRDRLKIDARKWVLGKMMPKKYGDKVELETNVTGVSTFSLKDLVNFK
jgi:hypothetical protein